MKLKRILLYRCNQNLKLFKFYKIDINKNKDRNRLYKIIKKFKPHYIINYSAQGMVAQSWAYPEDWYMTNLVSQSILYKNLMKFKFIKKMIHFTTPEVYGSNKKLVKENFNFKPSTPYAVSRAAMDYHLMNFQKIMVYRLFLPEQLIFLDQANNYIESFQKLLCVQKKK